MPYPGAFITDGSYPELTKMTTSVGSRIVYYDTVDGSYGTPTHTAVIYSYTGYHTNRTGVQTCALPISEVVIFVSSG